MLVSCERNCYVHLEKILFIKQNIHIQGLKLKNTVKNMENSGLYIYWQFKFERMHIQKALCLSVSGVFQISL